MHSFSRLVCTLSIFTLFACNGELGFEKRTKSGGGSAEAASAQIEFDTENCTTRQWWNNKFTARLNLQMISPASEALPQDYAVRYSFDHAAAVAEGLSKADGSDVKLVYRDKDCSFQEVGYALHPHTTWNSQSTEIWFRLLRPTAASSIEKRYYLYFGDPNASNSALSFDEMTDYYENFNNAPSENYFSEFASTENAQYIDGQLVLSGTTTQETRFALHGLIWSGESMPAGYIVESTMSVETPGSDVWRAMIGVTASVVAINRRQLQYYIPPAERADPAVAWTILSDTFLETADFERQRFEVNVQPNETEVRLNGLVVGKRLLNVNEFMPQIAYSPNVADVSFMVKYDHLIVRKAIASDAEIKIGSEPIETFENFEKTF